MNPGGTREGEGKVMVRHSTCRLTDVYWSTKGYTEVHIRIYIISHKALNAQQ